MFEFDDVYSLLSNEKNDSMKIKYIRDIKPIEKEENSELKNEIRELYRKLNQN